MCAVSKIKKRFIFIALIFCLFTPRIGFASSCGLETKRIEGLSLAPLIKNGTTIEVRPTACILSLKINDIAIFHSGARKEPIAKIVKALPGDHFRIQDSKIYTNDQILKNSEGFEYTLPASSTKLLEAYARSYNGTIPNDTYLLIGDNPSGSLDSSRLGLIHKKDILWVGKAPNPSE